MRAKRPRLRLDAEAYRQLWREVLERDGWRCQSGGRMEDLQVHHIQPRSRLGDDTEVNLVILCAKCHQEAPAKAFAFRDVEFSGEVVSCPFGNPRSPRRRKEKGIGGLGHQFKPQLSIQRSYPLFATFHAGRTESRSP